MSSRKQESDHQTIIKDAINRAASEIGDEGLASFALQLYSDSQSILERPTSSNDALRKLLTRKVEE